MIALLLACVAAPPDVSTLYATCLAQEDAACDCRGGEDCRTDPETECALLDPDACAAGQEAACAMQEDLAPLLEDWGCWVLHYAETCDVFGAECG